MKMMMMMIIKEQLFASVINHMRNLFDAWSTFRCMERGLEVRLVQCLCPHSLRMCRMGVN